MAGSTFMITTVLLIVAIFNASGRTLDGGWNLDKTDIATTADQKIATTVLTQNLNGVEASWLIIKRTNKATGKVMRVEETYKGKLEGRDHTDITIKDYDITGTKIATQTHNVSFYLNTTRITEKSTTKLEGDGSKTEKYVRTEYPPGLSIITEEGTYKYEYSPDNKLIKTTRNATRTQGMSVETTHEVTDVSPDGTKKITAKVITVEGDKIITDVRENNFNSKGEELSSTRDYTIDYKNNTQVKETIHTTKNSDRSTTTDRKVWRTYANGTVTREQVAETNLDGEVIHGTYYPLEIEKEGKDPGSVTERDPNPDDTDPDSRDPDSNTHDVTEVSTKI